MVKALFLSNRSLKRAENILALYKAVPWEKDFRQRGKGWTSNTPYRSYDVIITDEFLPYLKDKGSAKIIMVGHGIDGAKNYGLREKNPYVSRKALEQMDYRITSGIGVVDLVSEECGGLVEVLPFGVPRTDALSSLSRKKGQKMTYLYAPTYRKKEEGEGLLTEDDLSLIDLQLSDNEQFIVKYHMVTRKGFAKNFQHIKFVDNNEPSIPYVNSCDVLITDYSSILFDAYLAFKPSVLYCPDKSQYLSARGMSFDYPDFYGSIVCESPHHLIWKCRAAVEKYVDDGEYEEKEPYGEVEYLCSTTVSDMCDGDSASRIIQFVESLTGE